MNKWDFLISHWLRRIHGVPLHRWLDENYLTHGNLNNAMDYAIKYFIALDN